MQDKEKLFLTYLKGYKEKGAEQLLAEIKEGRNLTLDINGRAPIHVAAYLGFEEIVQKAIEKEEIKPIDKKLIDKKGLTPLHWACLGHKYSIIEKLVSCNFDVDALDNDKKPPVCYMLASNNSDKDFASMKLMFDKSQDPVGLAKKALQYCGINHANPDKPTGDRTFLTEYIKSRLTEKEGSWTKAEERKTAVNTQTIGR